MNRVLEPELMEDEVQVKAYAEADFVVPHQQFIQLLKDFINDPSFNGHGLDLGCGPGDISFRFAKAFPKSKLDAVDGSQPMLDYAKKLTTPALKKRVNFINGLLPAVLAA